MPLPEGESLSGEIFEERVVLSVSDLCRMPRLTKGTSWNWWKKAYSV